MTYVYNIYTIHSRGHNQITSDLETSITSDRDPNLCLVTLNIHLYKCLSFARSNTVLIIELYRYLCFEWSIFRTESMQSNDNINLEDHTVGDKGKITFKVDKKKKQPMPYNSYDCHNISKLFSLSL